MSIRKRKPVTDKTKFGIGFEVEFNNLTDCNTEEEPNKYKNKKVFHKDGKTTFTSDDSKTENCFDWEAQIGVFDSIKLTGFDQECDKISQYITSSDVSIKNAWILFYTNTQEFFLNFEEDNDEFFIKEKTIHDVIESTWKLWQTENTLEILDKKLYEILDEMLDRRNNEQDIASVKKQLLSFSPEYYKNLVLLGKPQMTLSFHISKYFLTFLLYYLRNNTAEEKEYIKLIGCVLSSVIDQIYSFSEDLLSVKKLIEELKISEAFILLKTNEIKLTEELSVLGFVLYTSYYFYNLQKYKTLEEKSEKVPHFKALFSIKPRTSILEIYYVLVETTQRLKEFNFDFISTLIPWNFNGMRPTSFYVEILSGKEILKIGDFVIPKDAVFEFIGYDIGGPGYVAVEFRNFRKLIKIFGGNPYVEMDTISVEDFRIYSHNIAENFVHYIMTPITLFKKYKKHKKSKTVKTRKVSRKVSRKRKPKSSRK